MVEASASRFLLEIKFEPRKYLELIIHLGRHD